MTGAKNTTTAGIRRRRATLYPARLAVGLTTEMRAALDATAEAADAPVGDIAREVIRRGLPLVRDSLRKSRKRERTRERTD